MTLKRTLSTIGLVLLLALVAAACGEKYSAERNGKKLGEAICDLRDADDQDDVDEAIDEINKRLDKLGSKYSLYTAEDRNDIENNLADLAEHAIQGNTVLMQQDLTVLERSARNIKEDTNEVARAAWEGVLQGLSDCTQ